MTETLLAGAVGLAVLAVGGGLRWLTPGGVTAAAAVGAAILAGTGSEGLALLLGFFVSASLLTRLGGPGKPAGGREHGASGVAAGRSASQVLANGGTAALAGLVGLAGWPAVGQVALLGALAAATADTWATEVGTFAGRETRRITTWERVPPGTSGGVSWPGSLAGVTGAAAVGLAAGLLYPGGSAAGGLVLGVAAGGVGMATDSFLGATLERRLAWVGNDAVNFAGSTAGALAGLALGLPTG